MITISDQKELTDIEIGYIAGLIDGEAAFILRVALAGNLTLKVHGAGDLPILLVQESQRRDLPDSEQRKER